MPHQLLEEGDGCETITSAEQAESLASLGAPVVSQEHNQFQSNATLDDHQS